MTNHNRPDLEAVQLKWQQWRNERFNDLCSEERFVANNARGNAKKQGTRYAEYDNDLLAREIEDLEATRNSYGKLVALDTEIKNGYWRGTTEEWETALQKAQVVMGGSKC